ncbi:B12-binding domain-containing radical SAM protein [Candidatus Desantisbacteria bacterium CG_4_10_14_0_8_um_filter_39_17]|uniref:B12-binding domain-containing radical SAM protein n=2 Tax=unclassified Candidatus Desantisiibacteriota TaxID=3106372 RepID=A0A2H9PBM8_9BACT|nr:MAG: B12-binding domain-containing radical SAM protein [Candidatus Desantisbacteria bacterium CG_4_10_14_0_8_um_filter_39_17]
MPLFFIGMKTTIEEILGQVSKPTRYIGNEWNSVHKRCTMDDMRIVRVALAFPDLYEIGMSHLGMNILYHLLNQQEDVIAERVYAPWIDMEERLRHNKIPLFSLETHTPLKEFDIIGFSLQYEMCYTNVLTILDLTGIPVLARDRNEVHPLIIAGGACVFNPEPVSEFIDLFVIGETEESILDIMKRFKDLKIQRFKRQEILREMAKIEGVYVPSLYEVKYNSDSTVNCIKPRYDDVPSMVRKRIVWDLDSMFCPVKPIVPFQSIVHDRAVVEVFRGCTQGCRFCQAGMISRPVRMHSLNRLRELITPLMENTGWEEVSLLALNICDYPDIEETVSDIAKKYREKGVNISLPSLRPDNFSLHLAQLISMGARVKPTLTFAPEAGTQRLRNIINKNINQDELMKSIGNAYRAGWDSCKLYFMIGLPQETEEDIKGIVTLVKELKKIGQKINPKASIRPSISPFVPKSHTPFQWEPQERIESLRDKQKKILSGLRRIEVRWNRPEMSFLEGVFARGDRRLNEVLLCAWKNGARFDAWEETFKFSIWEKAFQEFRIDPSFYLYRKREYNEVLPWDHIDTGLTKEFLIKENKKSKESLTTPNCVFDECQECGVCDKKPDKKGTVPDPDDKMGTVPILQPSTKVRQRVRITFSKGEELKYISHLDLHRLLKRALRRANIPVAFSKSFHPHPEVILGLPLSVGMISDCELCDIFLSERMELDEFIRRLSTQLPAGFTLKEFEEIFLSAPALPNIINGVKYNVVAEFTLLVVAESRHSAEVGSVRGSAEFTLPVVQDFMSCLSKKIEEFLNQDEIIVHRKTPKVDKALNIRPLIENIECVTQDFECVTQDFECVTQDFSPANNNSITFEISLKITNEFSARPDEVIRSLLGPDARIIEIKRTEIKF